MIRLRRITALNAVTATTVSNKFWVGGARRVGIQVRRAAHSAGSTAFTVKGSLDPYELGNGAVDAFTNKTGGTAITMSAYNRLLDNANTTAYVTTKTLSANGDDFVWLDINAPINWIEVTATETTDGTHSAWILVEEDTPSNATF